MASVFLCQADFITEECFRTMEKPSIRLKPHLKRLCYGLEIEDFCFHDFRHCAVTNLRKAGNDYTTIMKASGHKTMSMFLRYNLVNEEDVAGMKWKDTDRDIQSISGSLKDIGLNPDVVLESLLLERGKTIR